MNAFYHGDCLFVMTHDIEPEAVDLIYLDPPFFTGKVQKAKKKWQPGAMEISYDDSKKFWGDDERCKAARENSPQWLQHIATDRPVFASYLWYMMERLYACKRVLKPTGSIYLHCNWRASHYLKMIMDEKALFGYNNFRNELVWSYQGTGEPSRKFKRKHDTILFYSKSSNYYFNTNETVESISDFSKSKYTEEDNNGKYKTIKHPDGKIFKQYTRNTMRMRDVWEIPIINAMAKERVGYPTQKPVALLKRIIKASSNKGDIVLDPFCGCGTAIIASQELGRQWIGIDINKEAYDVSKGRYHQLSLEEQTEYKEAKYVERDPKDVLAIEKPQGKDSFEEWVNGFFKARKPIPDEGIDGITPKGIPIQTKTHIITSALIRKLFGDAQLHPQVKQPCNHVILVSQKGFDDGAYRMQGKIQLKEGIKVDLLTPDMMLPSQERRK